MSVVSKYSASSQLLWTPWTPWTWICLVGGKHPVGKYQTKPSHLHSISILSTCREHVICFCRKTLESDTFCWKNLDYALRAKTLANLRSEPTPHFMRFMRFVQYGLLRVRNPLTVWYLILATGGILVLALVVYTVWGKYHVCVIVQSVQLSEKY